MFYVKCAPKFKFLAPLGKDLSPSLFVLKENEPLAVCAQRKRTPRCLCSKKMSPSLFVLKENEPLAVCAQRK